jgi:Zn-finger nucleic acid-binding protein
MPQVDCPRCSQELRRTSLGSICPSCEGVWFGFDQFDTALRLSDLQLETSEIEATLQFDKPGISLEHHIKCPDCGLRMKRHVYMMDSGVTVDMCRDHGMWLDDGELSKIRRYLQSIPDQQTDESEADKPGPVGFFRRLFGGKA